MLHMNGGNLPSPKWRELDENMTRVLHDSVIVNIAMQGKDKQLRDTANIIVEMSSNINLVKKHETDFKRLFWDASALVVVLWKLHDKHRRSSYCELSWPPPGEHKKHFDDFVKTVRRIHELMKSNLETLSKRITSGYFGIRDGGRFKKYQARLDSMASTLESKPNSIDIYDILVQVVRSRAQPDDAGTILSKESTTGNSNPPVDRTKERAVIQKPTAESSRPRKAESYSTPSEQSSENDPDPPVRQDTKRRADIQDPTEISHMRKPKYTPLSEESNGGDSDPPVRKSKKKRPNTQEPAESSHMRKPKCTTLSEEFTGGPSDSPVNKGKKKRADIQESTAESSRLKHADLTEESNGDDSDPPVKYKGDKEVDRKGSKISGQSKGKNRAIEDRDIEEFSAQDKSIPKKIPSRPMEEQFTPQRELKGTPRTKKVGSTKSDKETPRSEDKGKEIKFKTPQAEGVEEGTSRQGSRKASSRTNTGARSKTRERQSQLHEDRTRITDGVLVDEPATARARIHRSPTVPLPIQSSISDYSFQNMGTGEMRNSNIGNIRNIQDTRNRQERGDDALQQIMRSQTIEGFAFINRGGTMINQNVGNIENSTISDVGNDYSKSYIRRF